MCGQSGVERDGPAAPDRYSSVPRGGWPGHPLFGLENLYRAYRQCRRRKRNTHNALVFERALEDNLVALRDKLERGTYRPGRFLAFMVEKPKRREIFAADFRDRVVHHLLVAHLERALGAAVHPRLVRLSPGEGHAQGRRAAALVRAQGRRRNGTRPAWYLQLDVRGFFVTLDRQILWDRFAAAERDPAVLWLLRLFLFHEPTRTAAFAERAAPTSSGCRRTRRCSAPRPAAGCPSAT